MYSFTDLFKEPVDLDKSNQVVIDKIVIPKIQRPYAQGRLDGKCSYVRDTLLTELFSTIQGNDIFTLNFVYGIVKQDKDNYIMELLDGQQRLTTLFLVHWYIVNRELQKGDVLDTSIRECLSKFTYETRSTSTVFCTKLANYYVNLDEITPSQAITKAKWYFKSFDRDSTITAMLTMLDSIHKYYNQQEKRNLNTKLCNLRFYVKSLGFFNLSEELYIKMNARGLQLSSFENFKADLTNFVSSSTYEEFNKLVPLYKEGSTDKVPFSLNFSIKLDAKWVDIFWKKGTENFDSSYMSFFSRFFACKYIVDSVDSVTDREMRSDAMLKNLYTDAEDKLDLNEYMGFQTFSSMLEKNPHLIITLDKVLDVLHQYDCLDGSRLIRTEFTPTWERTEDSTLDDFYCNSRAKMTHIKLILLGAVIEFVDNFNIFELDVFKEWMRVCWNIIENTNIDSLTPVSALIRKFSSIICHIATESKNGQDFYKALSTFKYDNKEMRTVVEEVEKAKRISEDINWLAVFKDAERHPYFKGMVLFFYSEGISLEQYKKRLANMNIMFDKDGISAEYRKQHILIRAIVCCHHNWEREVNELYVTENSEKNKYLKNILASHNGVKQLFAEISQKKDITEIKDALNAFISSAPEIQGWNGYERIFSLASKRLHNDVMLYDWVFKEESNIHSCFRIYWYEGHIMFAAPRKQYAKVAIDTERAIMAHNLVSLYGFSFDDDNQRKMYDKYHDCFGNEVWVGQLRKDCKIWVGFRQHHSLQIQIECQTIESASKLVEQFEGASLINDDENWIILPKLSHYSVHSSQNKLFESIENVFEIIPECNS